MYKERKIEERERKERMQKASEKWGRLVERGIMRAYEIEVGGKSVECREEREEENQHGREKREKRRGEQ